MQANYADSAEFTNLEIYRNWRWKAKDLWKENLTAPKGWLRHKDRQGNAKSAKFIFCVLCAFSAPSGIKFFPLSGEHFG
jgi:hypothetical protein